MKKGSIKNNRINMEVQRALSEIIRSKMKDPRISPMTSVTDAIVTADLKYCTAYISVLGGSEEETLAGLKSAAGFIRSQLAQTVNLRITPEIRFLLDKSMEHGMHIESLLKQIKEDQN